MYKPLRMCSLAAVILVLSACSSMGLVSPQTFNEKVAVAYASVTQVRSAATTLVVSKKITKADAQNVQTQADAARAGIDVARTLHKTDIAAGATKLTTVLQSLEALQAYLQSKGGA